MTDTHIDKKQFLSLPFHRGRFWIYKRNKQSRGNKCFIYSIYLFSLYLCSLYGVCCVSSLCVFVLCVVSCIGSLCIFSTSHFKWKNTTSCDDCQPYIFRWLASQTAGEDTLNAARKNRENKGVWHSTSPSGASEKTLQLRFLLHSSLRSLSHKLRRWGGGACQIAFLPVSLV